MWLLDDGLAPLWEANGGRQKALRLQRDTG